MVVCLLGIAATASAQFANSSSNSSADASAWKGIRASYLPISIKADGGGSIDYTGFQAGYVKSFAISATPLLSLAAKPWALSALAPLAAPWQKLPKALE